MNNNQPSPTDVTQRWLERIVIGLNLCPFAKHEYRTKRIRFKESSARDEESLLQDLMDELTLLNKQADIETAVLIAPHVLTDFSDYNHFLGFVDTLIQEMNLEGVFQIASFHPHYQFSGTEPDDVENYTNRAPYPLLHILREASLEQAIDQHPNTEQIPDDNIELMRSLGTKHMSRLLDSCRLPNIEKQDSDKKSTEKKSAENKSSDKPNIKKQ